MIEIMTRKIETGIKIKNITIKTKIIKNHAIRVKNTSLDLVQIPGKEKVTKIKKEKGVILVIENTIKETL